MKNQLKPITVDHQEVMTPLPSLRYKDYFKFLMTMKDRYGNHHAAETILNKFISTKCLFNKTQFYSKSIFSLGIGVYLWPVENPDARDYDTFCVYIGDKFYHNDDEIKKAIRKIYAEYEAIPIILSDEAKEIYLSFLN